MDNVNIQSSALPWGAAGPRTNTGSVSSGSRVPSPACGVSGVKSVRADVKKTSRGHVNKFKLLKKTELCRFFLEGTCPRSSGEWARFLASVRVACAVYIQHECTSCVVCRELCVCARSGGAEGGDVGGEGASRDRAFRASVQDRAVLDVADDWRVSSECLCVGRA